MAAALVLIGVVGAGAYAAFFGDSWGGRPRVVVPVQTAAAPPAAVVAAAPLSPAPAPARNAAPTSVDVETTSGVAVVRPHGAAGSEPILIRVPDRAGLALAAVPDERLVEKTKLGPLPRIGPDGSRASTVYARPVGVLPNGGEPVARIAILVGGLGLNPVITDEAIARLPETVTLAFAPYGGDLASATRRAREAGHEIMLQMPMEPLDYPTTDPGPQTLTTGAKPGENLERLRWGMSRFTGFVGVSNFLGGKLTGDEAALTPILREIGSRGLAFVDDGSSSRSLAAGLAAPLQMSAVRADVMLDPVARADMIDRALDKLEATARERGFALGSASGLPLSVERIARWAEGLERKGILLVPVSAAFAPRGRS